MKKLLIVIIIVIIGGILYVTLTKNTATTSGPLSSDSTATAPGVLPVGDDQIGRDFLTVLLSLKTIKLNDELFKKPAFQNLRDYTKELIETDPKGRPNPFAPIGNDVGSIAINDPTAGANAGGVIDAVQQPTSAVTTAPAEMVTRNGVRLGGTLASGVVATTRWFEFGTSSTLGTKTPNIAPTSSFTYTLTTLTANTTYYYRACAAVATVPVCGSIVSWKTLP